MATIGGPGEGDTTHGLHSRKSRTNGFSCPPHPLQILMWMVLTLFGVGYFGVIPPCLPFSWRPAGYMIPALVLLFHLVVHVTCMATNPADDNVRRKKRNRSPKAFDKSKHKHVIENLHCNICEVFVSNRSKHCSVCNKCIVNFDHHCSWLNSCIGGRNYRLFIMTMVSGFVLLMYGFSAGLLIFLMYFISNDTLRQWVGSTGTETMISNIDIIANSTISPTDTSIASNNEDFLAVFVVVPDIAFLAVTLMISFAVLIAAIALAHLIGFHIYLSCKNISTYDHVLLMRAKDAEDVESSSSKQNSPNHGSKVSSIKANQVGPVNDKLDEDDVVQETIITPVTNQQQNLSGLSTFITDDDTLYDPPADNAFGTTILPPIRTGHSPVFRTSPVIKPASATEYRTSSNESLREIPVGHTEHGSLSKSMYGADRISPWASRSLTGLDGDIDFQRPLTSFRTDDHGPPRNSRPRGGLLDPLNLPSPVKTSPRFTNHDPQTSVSMLGQRVRPADDNDTEYYPMSSNRVNQSETISVPPLNISTLTDQFDTESLPQNSSPRPRPLPSVDRTV